jgi:hypothetical protein
MRSLLGNGARPFPYPRSFVVRAMALMWTTGGTMLLASALLPHPSEMNVGAAVTIGLLAVAVGGCGWFSGQSWPPWAFPALTAVGTCLITVMVVAGGGGTASVSFSLAYVWV